MELRVLSNLSNCQVMGDCSLWFSSSLSVYWYVLVWVAAKYLQLLS